MTEQNRRFEDQLPEQRIDWEHDGEPSSDPIRVERQQALLNYAAGFLKAERAACSAVVFPGSSPEQYILIGTADDILRLLPLPGATDGILRSQIRDLTTLLVDRQPADHLLDDPDLVRLVSALTAMAVRSAAGAPLAAPVAAATEQATDEQRVWIVNDDEGEHVMMCPAEPSAEALTKLVDKIGRAVYVQEFILRPPSDAPAAPLATPADAGAGPIPTTGNEQIDNFLTDYEIRADEGVYSLTAHDRWLIANFLIELDEEVPFISRAALPANTVDRDAVRNAALPPLPEPIEVGGEGWGWEDFQSWKTFTVEHMQEYGAACAAAAAGAAERADMSKKYDEFKRLSSILKTPGYCDGTKYTERQAFYMAVATTSEEAAPAAQQTDEQHTMSARPFAAPADAPVDKSKPCRNVLLRVGYGAVPKSCQRCGLAKECPEGHASRKENSND